MPEIHGLRRGLVRARVILRHSRALQIAALAGFWAIGQAVVRALGLPIPGAVVGMAILLLLLAGGLVQPPSLRRGARWLLAEMLLFFVPAVMALLDHQEFVSTMGLKLLAVIVAGTLLVMGSTALAVDLTYRWRMRHGH